MHSSQKQVRGQMTPQQVKQLAARYQQREGAPKEVVKSSEEQQPRQFSPERHASRQHRQEHQSRQEYQTSKNGNEM